MQAKRIKPYPPKHILSRSQFNSCPSELHLDPTVQAVQKFDALLEECPVASFQATLDGQIRACNHAFVKLLGYSSYNDALTSTWEYLRDDSLNLPAGSLRVQDSSAAVRRERTLHRKDGTVLHVIESTAGIFDESNKLIGIRGFLLDQTEQANLEKSFLRRQKMESLGWFAGGFVHDFNNILVILLGNCSLLESKLPPEGDMYKLLQSMQQAVDRGIDLTKSFLSYTRKNEVSMETMNVNSLITGLSKLVEAALPKSIKLELDLDDHLPKVSLNSMQIQQAVLNLCMNARDAMANTVEAHSGLSVLKIRTSQVDVPVPTKESPRHLCIEVSDTGKGMNPSITQKMFEPFFTTKDQGTGLGLAIVQMVTKKHDGFIDVVSKEGEGTSVKLFFPLSKIIPEQVPVPSTRENYSHGRPETILFAEADERLALVVKTCFESKGYHVLLVKDGISAIQCYEKNKQMIDIVFLDIDESSMNGVQAFAVLRDLKIQQRVILASAHIGVEERRGLLMNGLCEYIPKPYVPHDVLESIRNILNSEKKQAYPKIFSTKNPRQDTQDHSA